MGNGNTVPTVLRWHHRKSPQNQNRLGPCLTRSGKDFNICMSNAYLSDAYMREVYMSNEVSTPGIVSDSASDILSNISSGPESDTSDSTSDNTPDNTTEDNLDDTMDDVTEDISDDTSASTSDDIPYDIEDDSVNDGTSADLNITYEDGDEDDVLPSIEGAISHPIRDDTNLEEWPKQSPVVEDLKVSHYKQT
jgi:hypothetical protein